MRPLAIALALAVGVSAFDGERQLPASTADTGWTIRGAQIADGTGAPLRRAVARARMLVLTG
jgi:hypothetical protein